MRIDNTIGNFMIPKVARKCSPNFLENIVLLRSEGVIHSVALLKTYIITKNDSVDYVNPSALVIGSQLFVL